MEFKLEKNLDILFGIFKNHKKDDIVSYYNEKLKKYSKKDILNNNYALSDTIMKFSNLPTKKSLEALSELQLNKKLESPLNYYIKKCQKYIKIDKKDDVFAHALIDTYKKFIKYWENKK